MGKPVIDAREVLTDLKSGLDDRDLMKKYKLSSKGLESLFKKLEQAGVIKQVSARELLHDISIGIPPASLMEKFNLSLKGLQKVFHDLDLFGLLRQVEQRRATREKKRISTSEVLADIRARMAETLLMKKYGISAHGLQRLYAKLREAGLITQEELDAVTMASDVTVEVTGTRQTIRHYPLLSLTATSLNHHEVSGLVRDLSEKGVGISGFPSELGEEHTLAMKACEACEVEPFMLKAECKWCKIDETSLEILSGYEITEISEESLKNLREFIRSASIVFGEEE